MNAARWAAIFQRQNTEPPAGRLKSDMNAARWAAISKRQNTEPPAGRLYFNAIIV